MVEPEIQPGPAVLTGSHLQLPSCNNTPGSKVGTGSCLNSWSQTNTQGPVVVMVSHVNLRIQTNPLGTGSSLTSRSFTNPPGPGVVNLCPPSKSPTRSPFGKHPGQTDQICRFVSLRQSMFVLPTSACVTYLSFVTYLSCITYLVCCLLMCTYFHDTYLHVDNPKGVCYLLTTAPIRLG